MNSNGMAAPSAQLSPGAADEAARAAARHQDHVTSRQVWRALAKASFAVVSHLSADGEPRSSGVVYGTANGRLYLVVAPDSWKARQIATGQEVAVTVPVRRGGLLSLVAPIPPATITFEARATVHAPGTLERESMPKELVKLLPKGHETSGCVIELEPEGRFLTYGIGVSLMDMRDPTIARARVPVS